MSNIRKHAVRRSIVLVGLLAAATVGWTPAAHAAPATTRISVGGGGQQANGTSVDPAVNIDGTVIAFTSGATNLTGVPIPDGQIYVRDTVNRTTELVSGATGAGIPNDRAVDPSISEDGRLVAFQSAASNLVPGDTNGSDDIFVRDRATGVTTLISVSVGHGPTNGASGHPAISGDGRYVAFHSSASNLAGGDTNNAGDIFVYGRVLRQTTRASEGPAGAEGNGSSWNASISRNGDRIAFHSSATNLINRPDTNSATDVFVASRNGVLLRASETSNSAPAGFHSSNASISADGQTVVFESRANNLVPGDTNDDSDIFRHEVVTGLTTLVSSAANGGATNGDSLVPSISADGRRVVYTSSATNLVGADGNGATTDVFVTDLTAAPGARNTLVSVSTGGAAANGAGAFPALSHNGLVAAYHSTATNLVAGDTNARLDVFVRTS